MVGFPENFYREKGGNQKKRSVSLIRLFVLAVGSGGSTSMSFICPRSLFFVTCSNLIRRVFGFIFARNFKLYMLQLITSLK